MPDVALALAAASACPPVALQRRGLIGLIALAACYFLLPLLMVVGLSELVRLMPLALLGAAVLAYKDVRDEAGDRVAGKRTLVVRFGPRGMSLAVIPVAAVAVGLLVVTSGAGWWVGPAVGAVGGLVALAANRMTLRLWLFARLMVVASALALGAGV